MRKKKRKRRERRSKEHLIHIGRVYTVQGVPQNMTVARQLEGRL